MRNKRSLSKFFLAVSITALISFGCNKKDEAKTPDNRQSTNTSANYTVNNGNAAANR